MAAFTIAHLTFAYPGRVRPALDDVELTIAPGEFVVLCGPSGCGKTTLLRQLKPDLTPHGVKSGQIFFDGKPLGELDRRDAAAKIGFVMQSPENQIVTDKVWHELAFGLESLGYDTPSIRLKVAEMASFFGIQTWFHKAVTELSGGQKQLLALAGVMTLSPSVLILDEPTSQLDPIAASEFLATIGKINRELGVTVILTEHRLEEAFPLCTRAIVMDNGRVLADGSPVEIAAQLREQQHGMFQALPVPMRVWSAVDNPFSCPVTVRDGREWLNQLTLIAPLRPEAAVEAERGRLAPAVVLAEVYFKYAKDLPDVVKALSFKAYPGEITAILGGNGAGKTTALALIARLNRPYRGKVTTQGVLAALPQNPQALFTGNTVAADLMEIFSGRKITQQERQDKVRSVVQLCRLETLLLSHPYDLSGGEQQRAALAKVLLTEPDILLLDEPTKGLDAEFKVEFARILRTLARSGVTVVMVSHDVEFCAEYADRCALFFDGNIVTEGRPRAFFSGNSFYTTAANRMARHTLPEAITARDVINALGGQAESKIERKTDQGGGSRGVATHTTPARYIPEDTQPMMAKQPEVQRSRLPKRTWAAMLMIFLAIPLTIYIGNYVEVIADFLGDRRYYFISLLIIVETMLPFALVFESRKPQARELVVIAVLCAIAVVGRTAFFMLPQFKPVLAVVIIAGVAFGGEAGFLVGALTGFVSNFFFGQGPWTPWQMFAFGIIGFLAGLLFRKGLLRRNRWSLCTFGALAAVIIYGGIMNPAQIMMYQAQPSVPVLLAAYASGLPFDLVHALATVIFLALIARAMLEKLDRIKIKYGLIEQSER
jgi:energy-coupling factor transporter ATP-binding protein EcfA2/uncharacterized membrane protein